MKTVRLGRLAAVVIFFAAMLVAPASRAGSKYSPTAGIPQLSSALAHKLASGNLIRHLAQKFSQARAISPNAAQPSIIAAVYSSTAPSPEFLQRLSAQGVTAFPATWTPPSDRHPLGYFLAQMPAAAVPDVLSFDDVRKMDTAESESIPQSNEAARAIKADLVWSTGLTGSGVKVGVLDSGLDISFAGSELPSSIQKRDYSLYPSIDTTVANTVTGHGTHVTGIVLARGINSRMNTANGGGAYKGMAPAADLVFLKIGIDGSGGANEAAEIAAIHAAVDSFHVNVINLSYGGWEAYHDGSGIVAQAIDWAYSRGVACFVAAGNFGNLGRHASGYVMARDTSGFIEVSVPAASLAFQLAFNLVWFDGAAHNNLSLLYYDSSKTLLTDVSHDPTTESPRGTESQFSQYNTTLINQSGTFYIRVVNPSPVTQTFHVYENSLYGFARFAYPDPKSTISTPGDADGAFTVGAYSAHEDWTGMDGGQYTTGMALNAVPSFSSQGPRVDGQLKPNLIAPGCMVISLRDRDVFAAPSGYCVDDDGVLPGGSADYYVMHGTSMASPVAAGAAALLLQQDPSLTPQQLYDALMQNASGDAWTGPLPNPVCGFGKLNVFAALQTLPLPVELSAFESTPGGGFVLLTWSTKTETKNYGFEIERTVRPDRTAAIDPAGWTNIGFVAGSGTSAAPHAYSFTDRSPKGGSVSYRLKQIDSDGRSTYSRVIDVNVDRPPSVFSLAQNFPNPFNPSTRFRFSLPAASRVRLEIFDVLGRQADVVLDRVMEAGSHTVEWNAVRLPSGVYFYRLEAGAFHDTKKLLLQK